MMVSSERGRVSRILVGTAALLSLAGLLAVAPTRGGLGLDEAILRRVAMWRNETLSRFVLAATHAGDVLLLAPVAAGISLFLWRRGQRYLAGRVLTLVWGACAFGYATKQLVGRYRPTIVPPLVEKTSYSLPSGHAVASAALAVALFGWLCRAPATASRVTWTGGLALLGYACFIALSRIYLGVHYPSDVVASWLLVAAWSQFVDMGLSAALSASMRND